MPNKALPYLNFIALNVLRAWYTMVPVHQQEWGDHVQVPVPVCVSILLVKDTRIPSRNTCTVRMQIS
jgi:hypothetical protein